MLFGGGIIGGSGTGERGGLTLGLVERNREAALCLERREQVTEVRTLGERITFRFAGNAREQAGLVGLSKVALVPDSGQKEGAAWFASGNRSRVPRTVVSSIFLKRKHHENQDDEVAEPGMAAGLAAGSAAGGGARGDALCD